MNKKFTAIAATIGALALSGCVESDGFNDATADTVCDAEGNRYPSAAIAESVGLEPAEYGATFCE
ncbi:hypothetical protein D1823_11545 [Ruegeria sp. AD91A]|uniref:hypothetical protein n=1 Tax=Ruegeria sp. AD91A TaxID=2293862 RepID=UPI000E5268DE|nr:hypothetical protein [Ruegeria sp. AD91A]AXT27156.1 hypothetical protein D1823_11545 [Ruegeria sp. AD91A]